MKEFLFYIRSNFGKLTKSDNKELINKIEYLITNGADINTKDDHGFCLLDYLYESEIIKSIIHNGGIGRIATYNTYREYFTHEQQNAFDSFLLLTDDNEMFFQMCLAYQNDQKNKIEIEIKDMDIL